MKKKVLSILFALVLLLTLGLVTAAPVSAATIEVPTGYTTIQAAIDAAGPDDIINVAAGTYDEDLVIPDTKTNLEFVGATGAIIKGQATSPGPFPDGVPNIEILASGVKIHGFTIEGPDAVSGRYSMGMYIGASNVEIYDNAFLTPTQGTGQYSVVIQTYRTGILAGVDISGLNIHDNTFDDIGGGAVGYDAIFVNLDTGTGLVTIADNEFTGSLFRAISVERSNVVISGNSIITDLSPYEAGAGGYQGMYIGCFPVDSQPGPEQSNVSITGNTVKGSGEGLGFVQGIRVGSTSSDGFSDITVSQNTVQYNTDGIVVKAPTGASVDVVINDNYIVGNTDFGVNNATIDQVSIDATSNWWGTTVDSEIAAMVNGEVDYSSFLTQPPSSVVMTASSPSVIGISVTPTSVNFGNLIPGTASSGVTVTVTNEGNVAEDFSATIENESPTGVYTGSPGLTMNANPVASWLPTGVAPAGTAAASLVLTVPTGTPAGTYTATLVFWAEATP